MFNYIIKLYFKAISYRKKDKIINKLNNHSLNPTLIKEIYLLNNFKESWRSSIGYALKKEKYVIKNISSKKNKNTISSIIKVQHNFIYNKGTENIPASEILEYAFFCKKINLKWFIVDVYNKEIFSSLYNKVTSKDFDYFSRDNSNLLFIRDNIKLHYWQNKLKYIESLVSSYKKILNSKKQISLYRNYNRSNASFYAQKYALNYNKSYKDFNNNGGDCTNYISQCLHAGGIPLSNNWSPYKNSWIRVKDLYYYLINTKIGIDADLNSSYSIGDIIQFFSNEKGFFSHSGIITKINSYGEYFYCCHSLDKLNFPLSEIYPLFYDKYRIIHINDNNLSKKY